MLEALDANAIAVIAMVQKKDIEMHRTQVQRQIKALKKDLPYKESAMAALLVLQKSGSRELIEVGHT